MSPKKLRKALEKEFPGFLFEDLETLLEMYAFAFDMGEATLGPSSAGMEENGSGLSAAWMFFLEKCRYAITVAAKTINTWSVLPANMSLKSEL